MEGEDYIMLIKADNMNKVLSYLNENPIINLNIIGIIENEPEAEVYVDNSENPTGVLVRYNYFHFMYTESDSFIDEVIAQFFKDPGWYGFSGLYKPIADKLRPRFENQWESCCDIYYLPKERLDKSLINNIPENIRLQDAETVDKFYTYRNDESLGEIKKDILYRPSSAIYVNNEPVCWVLVHHDNSMGIMYTREEFRNRGYAVDVTLDLASKIIDMGKQPFLQINTANNMSPGLALKCGFKKYERCDWFGFIVGTPKELKEGCDEGRDMFLASLKEIDMDKVLGGSVTNLLGDRGMHMFLINLSEGGEEIQGFTVKRVNSPEEKSQWCSIIASHFNMEGDKLPELENMLNHLTSSDKYTTDLYLGLINGIPVSALGVHKLDHWSGGIYLIAATQDKNRIYSNLIRGALKEEKAIGCETIFASPTDDLYSIFKEIGFRE